ncbi:MAG: hypothetical protein FWG05_01285, partial [Kiritimatiellaeota bacterium]|nr:hypothetical protein [Kiritimatiellota bacterium]
VPLATCRGAPQHRRYTAQRGRCAATPLHRPLRPPPGRCTATPLHLIMEDTIEDLFISMTTLANELLENTQAKEEE